MSLTLSDEELRELTGCKQPAAQVRWLKLMFGMEDVPRNAAGRPRVLRSEIEQRQKPEAATSIEGPNWNWKHEPTQRSSAPCLTCTRTRRRLLGCMTGPRSSSGGHCEYSRRGNFCGN